MVKHRKFVVMEEISIKAVITDLKLGKKIERAAQKVCYGKSSSLEAPDVFASRKYQGASRKAGKTAIAETGDEAKMFGRKNCRSKSKNDCRPSSKRD